MDVKPVGKELGVRYALEGSEQHSGNKVRVNAQLIDAESGTHLWADQFDEDRSDLLQMQDAIVTRVARALHFELVTIGAAQLARSHPGALGADDLSLRCQAAIWNSETPPDGCGPPSASHARQPLTHCGRRGVECNWLSGCRPPAYIRHKIDYPAIVPSLAVTGYGSIN